MVTDRGLWILRGFCGGTQYQIFWVLVGTGEFHDHWKAGLAIIVFIFKEPLLFHVHVIVKFWFPIVCKAFQKLKVHGYRTEEIFLCVRR